MKESDPMCMFLKIWNCYYFLVFAILGGIAIRIAKIDIQFTCKIGKEAKWRKNIRQPNILGRKYIM